MLKKIENKLNTLISKYLGWLLYPPSKQGKEKQNKKWNKPK